MSRADCDACDEYRAKERRDLKTYKEASEAANRIIAVQLNQIAELNGSSGKECDTRENAIRARDNYYAEIMRLDKARAESETSWVEEIAELHKQLAAKDALNNDLMTNCNQLRDRCWKAEGELARWREIAIEERAKIIFQQKMQPWRNLSHWDSLSEEDSKISVGGVDLPCPGKAHWRSISANDLDIQISQEDAYLKRLENAYLAAESKLNAGFDWDGYQIEVGEDDIKGARDALDKIREGKT